MDTFIEAYKKLKFVAVIDPFMSETADYFADVVLPAATIEKYEGVLSVGDQYNDAISLRLPPIPPLYQSRGEIDIYLDLCEKVGILYGDEGYLTVVNKELKLKSPYALDLNTAFSLIYLNLGDCGHIAAGINSKSYTKAPAAGWFRGSPAEFCRCGF